MKTDAINTILFSSACLLATTSGQQIRGGSKKLDPAIAILPPSMKSARRRGLGERETQEADQPNDVWFDQGATSDLRAPPKEETGPEEAIEKYANDVEKEAEAKLKDITASVKKDIAAKGAAAEGSVTAAEITDQAPASPVAGEVVPMQDTPPAEELVNVTPDYVPPAEPVNAAPEAAAGGASAAQAQPVEAAPEASAGDAPPAEPVDAAPDAAAGDAPPTEEVDAVPEASVEDDPAEYDEGEESSKEKATSSAKSLKKAPEDAEAAEGDPEEVAAEQKFPKQTPAKPVKKAPDAAAEDGDEVAAEAKAAKAAYDEESYEEEERPPRPGPKGGLSHVFEEVPEAPEFGVEGGEEDLPVPEEVQSGKHKAAKEQSIKEHGMAAKNKNKEVAESGKEEVVEGQSLEGGGRGGGMQAASAKERGGMAARKKNKEAESGEEEDVQAQSIGGGLGRGGGMRRMMQAGGGGGDASIRKLKFEEYLNAFGKIKSRGQQNRPYYH
jgi:hypothetical protein